MLLKGRVIHQNIQMTEFLYSLLDGCAAKLWIFYIARNQKAAAAFCFNGSRRFLCISLLRMKKDHGNIGAFTGIQHGNSAANA